MFVAACLFAAVVPPLFFGTGMMLPLGPFEIGVDKPL